MRSTMCLGPGSRRKSEGGIELGIVIIALLWIGNVMPFAKQANVYVRGVYYVLRSKTSWATHWWMIWCLMAENCIAWGSDGRSRQCTHSHMGAVSSPVFILRKYWSRQMHASTFGSLTQLINFWSRWHSSWCFSARLHPKTGNRLSSEADRPRSRIHCWHLSLTRDWSMPSAVALCGSNPHALIITSTIAPISLSILSSLQDHLVR